jgi:hypothetical protein
MTDAMFNTLSRSASAGAKGIVNSLLLISESGVRSFLCCLMLFATLML